MIDATAIILTKNEQKNIGDCLKSLQNFAKRCVVVDSGSIDDTEKIARSFGADFYFHEFETHSKQFNWALDNVGIDTKWTIRIDADERFTDEIKKEYEKFTVDHDSDDVNGIVSEAWLYFMGKKIKHGCKNKRKMNLFKTGIGRIEDRNLDEHTYLLKGRAVKAKNKYIHQDFKDLDSWVKKLQWYASREVLDYIEFKTAKTNEKKRRKDLEKVSDRSLENTRKGKFGFYYKLPKFFRCWLLFVFNYVIKLGFLDGKEGFIYNYTYHRWYRTLVDAKIYEYEKTGVAPEKTGAIK